MNRDLMSELRKDNNYPTKFHNNTGDITNENPEMTQIIVDGEFDNEIRYLESELDIAKDGIKQMRQYGSQLRTNVNTARIYEINQELDRKSLEVSSRLRDIGGQLIALNTKTKSKPQDKNTKMRINLQRKLAKDLKDTLDEYNTIKTENEKEAFKMFRHQYRITKGNATEEEIEKAFEENNNEPVFIKELSNSQLSKRAYQESQDRNAELKRIEQSIEELLNTFQDMQNMLLTQNDAIISIEDTVDQAEHAVEQGSDEMVKAIKTRKGSRKVLWIITAIILVLLILLFSYIYVTFIKPAIDAGSNLVDAVVPDSNNNQNGN